MSERRLVVVPLTAEGFASYGELLLEWLEKYAFPRKRRFAEAGIAASWALLARWHGRDRLGYAITPRFAVTSSEAQLAAAGRLAAEFPDAHIHIHLAESRDEVDRVRQRVPATRSNFDVYR